MLAQNPVQHHRNHTKYYVVMITLVIVGIFLVIFMNSKNLGTLTGGSVGGEAKDAILSVLPESIQKDLTVDSTGSSDTLTGNNAAIDFTKASGVGFSLTFDQIPTIKGAVEIKSIDLDFSDLTTTIKVNGDSQLELNEIKGGTLSIENFVGDVNFDGEQFSLDGVARRIAVNGVAFSANKDIKISFDNLKYSSLQVSNIALKDIQFPKGKGALVIENKVQYTLDGDQIVIHKYTGSLSANQENESGVVLSGKTGGVEIAGEDLSASLS